MNVKTENKPKENRRQSALVIRRISFFFRLYPCEINWTTYLCNRKFSTKLHLVATLDTKLWWFCAPTILFVTFFFFVFIVVLCEEEKLEHIRMKITPTNLFSTNFQQK